jgi:molybdopterin molybdotransferase
MLVGVLVFMRPVLLRCMGVLGDALAPPMALRAHTLEPLPHKPGRTEYLRGVVSRSADGGLVVRSSGPQGSGVLRSVTEANALVVLPAETGAVAIGDAVDVWLLDMLW